MADKEQRKKFPPQKQQQSAISRAEKKLKAKRALSAYNLFFQEERRRVQDERQAQIKMMLQNKASTDSLKTVETMGFVSLARHIATKWNELDDESRAR